MKSGTIIIHLGAGYHAKKRNGAYRELLKNSLNSEDIVSSSRIIEGSQLTNTGYGSSLDIEGKVKCEATVFIKGEQAIEMGSVYNIEHKYPISVTLEMLDLLRTVYKKENNPYHLSKPVCIDFSSRKSIKELVSDQESRFIYDDTDTDALVSEANKQAYVHYKDKLFKPASDEQIVRQDVDRVMVEGALTDTIGLIFTDDITTHIYTSSGGNFFKLPGRIGCAGIPGAATELAQNEEVEVCCMCSGNGEDIIQLRLANTVASHALSDPYIDSVGLIEFIKQRAATFQLFARNDKGNEILYIGVVVVIKMKSNGRQHLVYCHSTESFYFGYKVDNEAARTVLSRQDDENRFGTTFVGGEFKLK